MAKDEPVWIPIFFETAKGESQIAMLKQKIGGIIGTGAGIGMGAMTGGLWGAYGQGANILAQAGPIGAMVRGIVDPMRIREEAENRVVNMLGPGAMQIPDAQIQELIKIERSLLEIQVAAQRKVEAAGRGLIVSEAGEATPQAQAFITEELPIRFGQIVDDFGGWVRKLISFMPEASTHPEGGFGVPGARGGGFGR